MGRVKYPQLYDAAWLTAEYVEKKRSTPDIGRELGCSPASVVNALHRLSIPVRGRHAGRWNPKTCERCGKEYTPSGPAQRFCSRECQAGTGTCERCGKEFLQTASRAKNGTVYRRKFCSQKCHREWQAEESTYRYVNADGYVVLQRHGKEAKPTYHVSELTPGGYLRRNVGGRRVLEHRWVMEQHLGRPLADDEVVHHVNGDRQDNRLENLQLVKAHHGKGQRFRCRSCGSHDVEAIDL